MKNTLRSLALALVVAALAPAVARAQYTVGNLRGYEQLSEQRWMMQRSMYYGPMGPTRAAIHQARDEVDETVHKVKQLTGDPDIGFYSRYDRRKLGLLGPYPTPVGGGAAYAAPVVMQQPVMGGAALNQTGGARFPAHYNAVNHLHW